MKVEITNDDIEYAEMLLLPPGSRFNEERRAFICCMESRDVVACPGSGKTTALLAKLLILARKMPLADGRGICVLTHTNVAIEIIKGKAGEASTTLFQYPSFFGTIQSFVNQFLAGPWYRSEFGRPLTAIDNDRFYAELERLYSADPSLRLWLEPKGGLGTLGSYWFNPETLIVGRSLNEAISGLSAATPTYAKIQAIRRATLNQGILGFNDAYALALRYLLKVPEVARAMSCRFCMVLMDETQDTDEHQFRVLDTLFDPDRLVVQRIGDPNQAIYHDTVRAEGCWSPRNPIHFSDSHRYGETITRLLSGVRLDDMITLQPCLSTSSFSPHLLTFEQGEEHLVIPAFATLITDLSNDQLPHGQCAAIGWIGRDSANDGKLCIPSYYPQYDRAQRAQNRRFDNLVSYAAHAIQLASTKDAKHFHDVVMQGVVHALDVAGIRDPTTERKFTSFTVQQYWKYEHGRSFDQFRAQIAPQYLSARQHTLPPVILRDLVVKAIKLVWPSVCTTTSFFTDDHVNETIASNEDAIRTRNRFEAQNGVVVDIGTVHSVKGETHFATLYLETRYQKDCDASRLIEFLKGNRLTAQLKKAHHQQNLKIAHVAFSRPTHLLAFACRSSSIEGHEKGLRSNGWVIRSVSEFYPKNQEFEP